MILIPTSSVSLALLALMAGAPTSQDASGAAQNDSGASQSDSQAALEAAFAEQGVRISVDERWCAIPAEVCVREDLLEYVLVSPHGAAHESLFATSVSGSILQTALLALGAESGTNAEWLEKDPAPSQEELAAGVSPYEMTPPTGTGLRLSVAWGEGEEDYVFRLEDLISNLRTGRSMRRHDWVYLGSRMVAPRPEATEEVLAADLEGNLINLSWFRAGNTLLTAAIPDSVYQTIWLPNSFLVPPRGTRVFLVFSRAALESLPAALAQTLPRSERRESDDGEGR